MPGGAGPRRVGSRWELEVRDYLRGEGIPADRAYGAGRFDDQGDLLVGHAHLLECKAGRRLELAEWLDQARRKTRAGDVPWVVVRRLRAGAARAYVVTDLAGYAQVLHNLGRELEP